MKVTLLCAVSLSWLLVLANASALPPNEVKEISPDLKATSEIVEEKVNSNADNLEHGGKDPTADTKRHNVDLSTLKISEQGEAETTVKEAAPWDSRQLLFNDHHNLKWVDWTGSLPYGAVSIQNDYSWRTDYVCSERDCSTGYYSPNKGAYCFYPENGKEYQTSSFKILVNENNFEFIQWQYGSYGDYPEDPIGRCPGTYVGKNKYGLGKVVPNSKVLFLPFSGLEYTYDHYEVLHLYADYHRQNIKNVNYQTNQIVFKRQAVRVLASSKVINKVCQKIKKTVSLSKTTLNDQKWDLQRPTKAGVLSMLSTKIPHFTGSTVTFLSAEEFEWREGVSRSKTQTHTKSEVISVDPNHECDVVLEGKTIYANMTFNADLSRLYHNGERRSTDIEGVFSNEQTDEVKIVFKGCRSIPNSPPCPP